MTSVSNTSPLLVTVNLLPNAAVAVPSTVCNGTPVSLGSTAISGNTYSWSSNVGTYSSTFANPTEYPSVTQTYTLTETITATGCFNSNNVIITVNQRPAATITSVATSICEGVSTTITGNLSATGTWNLVLSDGSQILGSGNTTWSIQVSPNINTTYSFSLVNPLVDSKCSATNADLSGSTYVTVNHIPVAPTITSNSPICEGATLTFNTGNVAGGTFSWTGVNSFTSSSQNPTIVTATTAATGNYTATVTVNGCTSAPSTILSATVNSIPVAPTITSSSPICEGATLTLNTANVTGGTFSWTGVNSFTSSSQNPTIVTATTAATGNYTATVTVNGCTSAPSTILSATVNSIPVAPTITSNSPICEGATLTFNTGNVAGGTFSWTGVNSFTSSSQNPTIANATTSVAGNYTATVTVNGCTSETSTVLSVVVKPVTSKPVLTSNSPICAGEDLNLSTPNVTGGVFSWTGVNSFSATDQNPTIANATTAASGDYIATVTVDGCVSEASDPVAVVVHAKPTIVAAASKTAICEGETVTLTATGAGATGTYSWDNGSATSLISLSTANSKTYSVTGTDENGCTNSSSVSVTVNSIPDFTLNSTAVCTGNPVSIAVIPATGGATDYNYTWIVPTGAAAPGSVSSFTTTIPGVYTGKIKNKNTACESATKNTTATFYPLPTAAAIVASDNKVMEGNSLDLTAAATGGIGAYTYTWIPNLTTNYSISGGATAVLNAIKEGVANIKYQVKDANNCLTQSANFEITIAPAAVIFDLPNAFTPNGDGMNDDLRVIFNAGVTALNSLKIFSRSGNMVFQSQDLSSRWDGRYNGTIMPIDIYYWTAMYIDRNGVVNSKTGTVLLLK